MNKIYSFFLSLVLLFSGFVSCTEDEPSIKYYDIETENQLQAEIDAYRSFYGLPGLVTDVVAQREAREYSRKVSEKIYNTTDMEGFDETEKLLHRIYSDAEIHGLFMHGIQDGGFVLNAWKANESDVAILKGDFNYIGVGVVEDDMGVWYYTAIFMKR